MAENNSYIDRGDVHDFRRLPPMRLNPRLLGLTVGLFAATGLFTATMWLLVKGGENVGAHLSLLGEYLPGYRVSMLGCFVGFAYAFIIGTALGLLMGAVYNAFARRR